MKRIGILILFLGGCGGCTDGGGESDDGPVDPAGVTVNNPGSGGPLPLGHVKYWAYQIQDHYMRPQALVDSHYDLLVVDQGRSISDMTDYDDAQLVAKLKASANHLGGNKIVLAYIDVGEAEDFRWYWQPGWGVGAPSFIVAADPDGWSGCYPVKYWDPEWKAIIFGTADSYVDRVIGDGYDGIYMDWLEAYDFEPVQNAAAAEGRNAEIEMVRFVKEISAYAKARKPGFIVIGQNASPLGAHADYLTAIDAQAQEDVWFAGGGDGVPPGDIPTPATGSWSTAFYIEKLAVFQAVGKPVFTCDYATIPANVAKCYAEAATLGYIEYVTTVELNALTSTPPPGY